MLRFKQFENLFVPKKLDGREEGRAALIQSQVKLDAERYAKLKLGYSGERLMDTVVDDIFYIWDQYVDDERLGIEHGRYSSASEKSKHIFHYSSTYEQDEKFIYHVKAFLEAIGCQYRTTFDSITLLGFTS